MNGSRAAIDYDGLAAEYARHRRLHPGVLRALAETTGLSARSRVLEIGCGTGNYLLAIAESVGCAAIGLDPSAAMLTQARARSRELPLIRARAEALPFPAETFDLVFSVDVIHHVRGRAASFAEAYRVLKPGGRLGTATDSADDIRRRSPLSNYFPETVPIELARYPAIDTLRAEMAAAGFRGVADEHVELVYDLTELRPYHDRAFSSLHLIPDEAVARGLANLEADRRRGPIVGRSLYTLVWGRRG